MLFKLAWKNIWRNPTRSLLVVVAVILGLYLGIFMVGFVNGLATQRLAFQLDNTLAHVKISNPEFTSEKEIEHFIDNYDKIIKILKTNKEVEAVSPRINFRGMIENQHNVYTVDIYGINPKQEKETFALYQSIIQGEYLSAGQGKTLVIGEKLAKRLSLELGSIVKLKFQDLKGNLTTDQFHIVGIYKIANTNFEGTHIFVKSDDLQKKIDKKTKISHQIAIKIQDYRRATSLKKWLAKKFQSYKIETWTEIAPDLAYIEVMMHTFFFICIGIILLGVSLGVVNTMLMAILERKTELNMLHSLGMKPTFIFILILFETCLLTLFGLPFGLFLAWISIYITGNYGIDLNYFSEGLAALGYDSLVYPYLSFQEYWQTSLLLFITALLSAIYPALKAVRLKK